VQAKSAACTAPETQAPACAFVAPMQPYVANSTSARVRAQGYESSPAAHRAPCRAGWVRTSTTLPSRSALERSPTDFFAASVTTARRPLEQGAAREVCRPRWRAARPGRPTRASCCLAMHAGRTAGRACWARSWARAMGRACMLMSLLAIVAVTVVGMQVSTWCRPEDNPRDCCKSLLDSSLDARPCAMIALPGLDGPPPWDGCAVRCAWLSAQRHTRSARWLQARCSRAHATRKPDTCVAWLAPALGPATQQLRLLAACSAPQCQRCASGPHGRRPAGQHAAHRWPAEQPAASPCPPRPSASCPRSHGRAAPAPAHQAGRGDAAKPALGPTNAISLGAFCANAVRGDSTIAESFPAAAADAASCTAAA